MVEAERVLVQGELRLEVVGCMSWKAIYVGWMPAAPDSVIAEENLVPPFAESRT